MKKLLTLILAAVVSIQLVSSVAASGESAAASSAPSTDAATLSIKHKNVEGDLVLGGSMDDISNALENWDDNAQKLEWLEDANGGYLRTDNIQDNTKGFTYTPEKEISAGKYKIVVFLRTAVKGHFSQVRLFIEDGKSTQQGTVNINNGWTRAEIYVELSDSLKSIKFLGGPSAEYVQPYCIDEFSITAVDEIPSDARTEFGSKVTPEKAKESTGSSSVNPIKSIEMWDPEKEAQYEVQGIMMNQDSTSIFNSDNSDLTEEQVRSLIHELEGTHVTDYLLCVNCKWSTFPSEVLEDAESLYLRETGIGATPHIFFQHFYNQFTRDGIDYFEIMLDELKKTDINGWISLRMNDAHSVNDLEANKHVIPDLWYEHPEYYRVQYDSQISSYYHRVLDFSLEPVRERMLSYINETLDRYDMYGIELDWMRECWLFYPGGEYDGLEIINQFMRDVDALVSVYEEKYGHEIKVCVRVPSDLQTAYDFSLDVLTWADEGIIDMLVAAGCNQTDTDVPVRMWKSLLKPYDIEFAPSLNSVVDTNWRWLDCTLKNYLGIAASWLSQGADKIYTFNIMFSANEHWKDEDKVADYSVTDVALKPSSPGKWLLLTAIGSYEKLMTLDRNFVVTYNDQAPMWITSNELLPFTVRSGQSQSVKISAGNIPEGATATLKFSSTVTNPERLPTVTINSMPAKYLRTEAHNDGRTDYDILCYEVPVEAFDDIYHIAVITAKSETKIDYIELHVDVPNN